MKTYYFSCPDCGQNEEFRAVTERADDDSTGLILLIGGILPALAHIGSRSGRVQCGKCGLIFRRPSYPSTGLADLGKLAFVLVLLLVAGFGIFYLNYGANDVSKYPGWVRDIVDFISRYKVYMAICVLPACGLILISILLGGFFSQIHKNYQMKKNYFYKPGQHDSIN